MKNVVRLYMASVLLFVQGISQAQDVPVLTLDECIGIAMQGNYSVKTAEYALQRRDAEVTSSYSSILPRVSMSTSSGRNLSGEVRDIRDVPVGVDPNTGAIVYESSLYIQPYRTRDGHNLGLNLTQNIYDGGAWWNQIAQAKSNQVSSSRSFDAARNEAVYQVTLRYHELAKAKALLNVYNQAVLLSEEQLVKTESMYELGSIARTDVYKAKVQLGNDKSNLLLQENIVSLARSNLNVVIGNEPLSPIEITEQEFPELNVPSLVNAIEDAERNNPSLKRFEADVESAKYGKRIAKAAFLPSIGASVRYSRDNQELSNVYGGISQNWNATLGLSLSFNLFNGFSDKASVEIAEAGLQTARENLQYSRRNLIASVDAALLKLKTYKELEAINLDNKASAEEDLRLARERYALGSGTLLEVQDAQVALTRSNATLVRTKYDSLIAMAELRNAMGKIR